MPATTAIPKTIHYVWFGGKAREPLLERCIQSWREHLPGYTITEWNESNYHSTHPFFERACREKNFGFASDVARLEVLHRHGGIYLDTDVEVKKSLDEFLPAQMFMGLELDCALGAAVIGAVAGHPLLRALLDEYRGLVDGKYVTNNAIFTRYLLRHCPEFKLVNQKQTLPDGIDIYPKEYFTLPPLLGPGGYTRHYATNSWRNNHRRPLVKRMANGLLGDALYLHLAHFKGMRANEFYDTYRQHNP